MHISRGPYPTKYRDLRGNWKPRRKPHFIRMVGYGWRVIQSVPGSTSARNAIGSTPAEALHYLEQS